MIVPDDKNWTWVLERECPECGLDPQSLDPKAVSEMARDQGLTWAALVTKPGAATRTRDDRWSVLEYACHVRDVLRLFDMRLQRMLNEDDPLFANWDQDATAIEERYDQRDPAVVATELVEAANAIADTFASVGEGQWQRVGRRSDGVHFTIESYARYFIHDPVHHVWDVTTG